jgi:hypothetical protein
MPVCKQCQRSRPIEEDEIKVDKQRGLILKHFKPCEGTKKYVAEHGKCGSKEYFSGPKDDSRARSLVLKKGIDEEEVGKFSIAMNPGVEPHELVNAFDDYFTWVETIEDEAAREAERDKMKQLFEAWKTGDELEEALDEGDETTDVPEEAESEET